MNCKHPPTRQYAIRPSDYDPKLPLPQQLWIGCMDCGAVLQDPPSVLDRLLKEQEKAKVPA